MGNAEKVEWRRERSQPFKQVIYNKKINQRLTLLSKALRWFCFLSFITSFRINKGTYNTINNFTHYPETGSRDIQVNNQLGHTYISCTFVPGNLKLSYIYSNYLTCYQRNTLLFLASLTRAFKLLSCPFIQRNYSPSLQTKSSTGGFLNKNCRVFKVVREASLMFLDCLYFLVIA